MGVTEGEGGLGTVEGDTAVPPRAMAEALLGTALPRAMGQGHLAAMAQGVGGGSVRGPAIAGTRGGEIAVGGGERGVPAPPAGRGIAGEEEEVVGVGVEEGVGIGIAGAEEVDTRKRDREG